MSSLARRGVPSGGGSAAKVQHLGNHRGLFKLGASEEYRDLVHPLAPSRCLHPWARIMALRLPGGLCQVVTERPWVRQLTALRLALMLGSLSATVTVARVTVIGLPGRRGPGRLHGR